VPVLARLSAAALFILGIQAAAAAHDLERTLVSIRFAADGRVEVDVANDPTWLLLRLERFAGGQVPARMTAAARDARLRELIPVFVDRIVLFVDGREIRPEVAEYLPPREATNDDALPPLATYRLRGRLPANARTLRWLYGLVLDPYPLTVHRADGGTHTEWIQGWNWSDVIDLTGQFRPPTRLDVAAEYLALGYTHILPKGVDHILFVLGLFLLSARLRPILLQVTAFTVAHSLTLALSMYGVVSLPSRLVEPLIALSIAYVAIENLVTSAIKPWRLGLVFLFGLLHGLGFAGVLSGLALPSGQFLTALLSFNLGVEAGQLTVIGAAAMAVAWFRGRPWYRRRVVVPASLAIAAVGVYWTITRVLV
jgi:hypothetical protein